MPNHCSNTVAFKGTEEQINALIDTWGIRNLHERDVNDSHCPLYACVPYPLAAELAFLKSVVNNHWKNETDEEVLAIKEAAPYYVDAAESYLLRDRLKKHLGKEELTLKDLFSYVKNNEVPPPYDDKSLPGRIAWGSKWGYYDLSIMIHSSTCIYLNAMSAWAPPLKGLQELSAKFGITIETEFSEPGCDFAGIYVFENGNEITAIDIPFVVDTGYPLDKEVYNKVGDILHCFEDDNTGYLYTSEEANKLDYYPDSITVGSCLSYREYCLLCEKGKLPPKELTVGPDGVLWKSWDFDLIWRSSVDEEWVYFYGVHGRFELHKDPEQNKDYVVVEHKMVYIEDIGVDNYE